MTRSELELAENLAGAKYPEQYALVMQDLLRKLLEEREQRREAWSEYVCAGGHRWRSERESRYCPNCRTSTWSAHASLGGSA